MPNLTGTALAYRPPGSILAPPDRQARSDYEEQLMPALEKIVKARRMLFVHVDT